MVSIALPNFHIISLVMVDVLHMSAVVRLAVFAPNTFRPNSHLEALNQNVHIHERFGKKVVVKYFLSSRRSSEPR